MGIHLYSSVGLAARDGLLETFAKEDEKRLQQEIARSGFEYNCKLEGNILYLNLNQWEMFHIKEFMDSVPSKLNDMLKTQVHEGSLSVLNSLEKIVLLFPNDVGTLFGIPIKVALDMPVKKEG